MDVLLYSRRGCGLCEEAEDLLAIHYPQARVVDVDGDDELTGRFGLRVPVLVIAGEVVLEGRFDEAAVARLRARA